MLCFASSSRILDYESNAQTIKPKVGTNFPVFSIYKKNNGDIHHNLFFELACKWNSFCSVVVCSFKPRSRINVSEGFLKWLYHDYVGQLNFYKRIKLKFFVWMKLLDLKTTEHFAELSTSGTLDIFTRQDNSTKKIHFFQIRLRGNNTSEWRNKLYSSLERMEGKWTNKWNEQRKIINERMENMNERRENIIEGMENMICECDWWDSICCCYFTLELDFPYENIKCPVLEVDSSRSALLECELSNGLTLVAYFRLYLYTINEIKYDMHITSRKDSKWRTIIYST